MNQQDAATERFRRLQDAVLAESSVAATSRFVNLSIPPLAVHILEAGAGEPVFMVHGGNSVAVSWGSLMGKLAPHLRLIMPDRPGCGLTTPFDCRGVNLRAHGTAFLHGVLEALGHRRVTLVGNSMGGFFAMAFAIAHPEMVSKLVLLGEPAGANGNPGRFHRLVGTRGINALLYATALRPATNAAGARRGLAKSRLVADPNRVPDTLLECFAAAAHLPGAVNSWTSMVEQVFVPAGLGLFARETTVTHALIPELDRLVAPTLFLWGDKDPLGSPDDGRKLAAHMPYAELRVVEDAGHLPWLDQPEVCAEAILAFLGASAAPDDRRALACPPP